MCFPLATYSCLCVDTEWEEGWVNQMLGFCHTSMTKSSRCVLENDDNNQSWDLSGLEGAGCEAGERKMKMS